MTAAREICLAPTSAILVTEVAAATGVPATKINRLIDESMLPSSARTKVGGRRALRAFAVPMVHFGVSDGGKLNKNVRLKAMREIEKFAKSHWSDLCVTPDSALNLRFATGCIEVALGAPVSKAMSGLNKWMKAVNRISIDKDVRGGLPVVSGTRVSVYDVADAFTTGGLEITLEDFPSLSREDVEAAMLYALAHPRTGRPKGAPGKARLVSEKSVRLPNVA